MNPFSGHTRTPLPHCHAPTSRRLLLRAALVLALLCPAFAARLNARLDRDQIRLGQSARLLLTVEDGHLPQSPELPAVDGLSVAARGVNQRMELTGNGLRRLSQFTYQLQPQRAGEFTIPPLAVEVDGQTLRTESLTLRVVDPASGAPAPAAAPGAPGAGSPTTPTAPGAANPAVPANPAESGRFGRLEIEFASRPRNLIWVGELVPVRIKALFPADVQVSHFRSQLALTGTDWTIHNLQTEPVQNRELIGDEEFFTLTWYAGLSPLRAGASTPEFLLPLVVLVPADAPDDPAGLDQDPLARSLLGRLLQRTEEREVDLRGQPGGPPREVRELPEAGRPADFTGLVGQFRLEKAQREASGPVAVGEPFALSAQITGSGNFALLDPPQPTDPARWRAYAGQSAFHPRDETQVTGSKDFRWTLAARQPGHQPLTLALNYFDPEKGQYQLIQAPPITIEVTGEAAPATAPAASATPTATASAASDPAHAANRGATPESAADPTDPPAAPLALADHPGLPAAWARWPARPGVIPLVTGLGLASLALAVVAGVRRQRQQGNRPQQRARRRELQRTLHAAAAAARARHTADFYRAARAHFARLLATPGQPPLAVITPADLRAAGLDQPEFAEWLRQADACEFAGPAAAAPADLDPSPNHSLSPSLDLTPAVESLRRATDPFSR